MAYRTLSLISCIRLTTADLALDLAASVPSRDALAEDHVSLLQTSSHRASSKATRAAQASTSRRVRGTPFEWPHKVFGAQSQDSWDEPPAQRISSFDWDEPPESSLWQSGVDAPEAEPDAMLLETPKVPHIGRRAQADPLLQEIMAYDWASFDKEEEAFPAASPPSLVSKRSSARLTDAHLDEAESSASNALHKERREPESKRSEHRSVSMKEDEKSKDEETAKTVHKTALTGYEIHRHEREHSEDADGTLHNAASQINNELHKHDSEDATEALHKTTSEVHNEHHEHGHEDSDKDLHTMASDIYDELHNDVQTGTSKVDKVASDIFFGLHAEAATKSKEQSLQASNRLEATSMSTGSSTAAAGLSQKLVSMDREVHELRGLLSQLQPPGAEKLLPPLAFVKTHRTGSSSVSNIVHRLGLARKLSFFLPVGDRGAGSSLGWPAPFPGPDAAAFNGAPMHKFDMLCNNAVFNEDEMKAYLKPAPFFFTVIRNPVTQMASSFTAYQTDAGESWSQRIRWLEQLWLGDLSEMRHLPEVLGHFRNPQAHDLGWYERVGESAVFDQDEQAMDAWLQELQLSMGLVMLKEYFDEGLVLLGLKLGLKTEDLVHINFKESFHRPSLPSNAEAERLEDLLRVDTRLYQHFNQTFWQQWELAGGHTKLGASLAKLKDSNKQVSKACSEKDEKCGWELRADTLEFTDRLRTIQLQRLGAVGRDDAKF